jgi:hypothetical protein
LTVVLTIEMVNVKYFKNANFQLLLASLFSCLNYTQVDQAWIAEGASFYFDFSLSSIMFLESKEEQKEAMDPVLKNCFKVINFA